MARIFWALLCHKTLIDEETQRLSVIDVIEFTHIVRAADEELDKSIDIDFGLQLVGVWGRSRVDQPEVVHGRIGLEFPDGTRGAYSKPVEVDLRDIAFLRHTVDIKNIAFHGVGIYEFLFEAQAPDGTEWKEMARVPLVVQLATPASA